MQNVIGESTVSWKYKYISREPGNTFREILKHKSEFEAYADDCWINTFVIYIISIV